MSISSTGLYGSATIEDSDLFNDVEALKEDMVTVSTSDLTTTQEHRDNIHTYVYTYKHTNIRMYIHTYMPIPCLDI